MIMRINKYIAKSGLASRRKAENYIKEGKVRVNGKLLKDLSYKVKKCDEVSVCGKILEIEDKFYYKLNKPIGFISSNYDPHNKKDLNDLINIDKRFFCAGRLDKDSHGLMLITNDGEITNKIIHPSREIKKVYIVKTNKAMEKDQMEQFSKSIKLSDTEKTSNAKIENIGKNTYKVTIHQGFNRQIRRMFAYFDIKVIDLLRVKIGKISLGSLEDGQYKKLSKNELDFLKNL